MLKYRIHNIELGQAGMNNKILFSIIAVAFVGGMFTLAYAGPALPLITLAGNVLIPIGDLTITLGDLICSGCIGSSDIEDGNIGLVDIGQNGCSSNQIMKWSGSQWVCNNIVLITTQSTATTVDSPGLVGLHTSIAIGNDGFPVISYHDVTNGNLKVAKCVNAACTGSSTKTTVDSTNLVGEYTSIAIGNDGFPVISYYDSSGNFNLKVFKEGGTIIGFN